MDTDILAIRHALVQVERDASTLPWAGRRTWKRDTHLGSSDGQPAVDLHDLSVRLALDAVARILEVDLQTGGFLLVTGRGRHTGGRSRLREAVLADLAARAERGDLAVHPSGPGRIAVTVDRERARRARPGLGLLFWLVVALVVAGILAALAG